MCVFIVYMCVSQCIGFCMCIGHLGSVSVLAYVFVYLCVYICTDILCVDV